MKEVARLRGHRDRVWCVAWRTDDELATSSGDTDARVWRRSEAGWECTQVLDPHDKTVRCVAYSPDGSLLATASFDRTVGVFGRMPDGAYEMCEALEEHESEVKAVAFSSGNKVATCGRDKTVWVFEMERGDDGMLSVEAVATLQGHTQDVKSVAWHPTKDVLLSCSYDDTVKVWVEDPTSRDEWFCDQTVTDHKATVWQLAFNRDGDVAATCCDDGTVIVWRCFDGRLQKLTTITGEHPRTVFSVAFHPERDEIATACGDDAVRVFARRDLDEAAQPGEHPGYQLVHCIKNAHDSDVNCVRYSPSGKLLASASDDLSVKLWEVDA